jgi:hypothetical protein
VPIAGGKRQRYVWDGKRIKPVNVDLLAEGYTPAGVPPGSAGAARPGRTCVRAAAAPAACQPASD